MSLYHGMGRIIEYLVIILIEAITITFYLVFFIIISDELFQ